MKPTCMLKSLKNSQNPWQKCQIEKLSCKYGVILSQFYVTKNKQPHGSMAGNVCALELSVESFFKTSW